jgi:Uncharacterized protein conserved in bacteria C-term(DUF2220)
MKAAASAFTSAANEVLSFDLGEPERYHKDVPNAKVYVLDAGHFALDTKADEIAGLVCQFMETQKQTHTANLGGGKVKSLLNDLRDNRIRKNLRLEQERIGFRWIISTLSLR